MPERQLLLRDGVRVSLGARALELLVALVERPGEMVSKAELLARVWPSTLVVEGNLKVNMATLRRTLGEAVDGEPFIATISGRGYRFVAPVERRQPPASATVMQMAMPRTQNLPSGTARIFGRAGEIDAIRADLERWRLVTIVGAGGIGKTTVAIAVAETLVETKRDGVWFVEFAALKDPAMAPVAVAAAIGVKTHSAAALDALGEYLRHRELLLVFDNCEHIVEAVAECADRILALARGVTILATSREPIGIRGERLRRLRGLGAPAVLTGLTAAKAQTFPAIQLFVDRATERLEWFELRDEDAPIAAEICRRLDGLALAIELAATRIDTFSVGDLLKQLDGRFRVVAGRRAGPERQRTLAATLDWSRHLLPAEEAELLDAVAVFAGAFGVDDAAAIANITPMDAATRLAQISAKSLLSTELDNESVVYRLLETTRAYCLHRLQDSGQIDLFQGRHAHHVCAVLARAAGEWKDQPAKDWGNRYRSVLNDLRIALAWAGSSTGDRSLLIELTVAGTLLWNHFSLTSECHAGVLRVIPELEAAGLSGTVTEMRLLTSLAGALMFTRGPRRDMLAASQRALEIAEALDDTEFRLRNLWLIGSYEVFIGQYSAAIDRMTNFLSIAAEKDQSAIPAGEALLAAAEFYFGRLRSGLRRVEQRFQPGLVVLEGSRLARFQFVSNSTFGVSLAAYQWIMGSPERAAQTVEIVIRQTLQAGHELAVVGTLVMSAFPVSLWRYNMDDARRYLVMLEHLLDQTGLEVWRPVARFYRGALICAEDETSAEGLGILKSAMADLDAIDQKLRKGHFLGKLAQVLALNGRFAEARETIEAALNLALLQNEGWCFPELLRIRASIVLAEGQRREAEAQLIQSMAAADEIGALSWKLRAANDLASLWLAEARGKDAHDMLLPIYGQFTEGHGTGDLQHAGRLLALDLNPTESAGGTSA